MNMVFVCVGQRLTSGVLTQEPSTLTFCHLFICGRSESWSFIFFLVNEFQGYTCHYLSSAGITRMHHDALLPRPFSKCRFQGLNQCPHVTSLYHTNLLFLKPLLWCFNPACSRVTASRNPSYWTNKSHWFLCQSSFPRTWSHSIHTTPQ